MKVVGISQNTPQKAKSILQNKYVLKGLEKVSEHGTSVTTGLSLLFALGLKPIVINHTPGVNKENKQYAIANTICASTIRTAMVLALAVPVENGIKRIDEQYQKFLKESTIKNLSNNAKKLSESRSYKFITQLVKLGVGAIIAIPKSFLAVALIPIVMDKLYSKKSTSAQQQVPKSEIKPQQKTSFTGNIGDSISRGLAKIIDNTHLQNFANKYQRSDSNIAKHITALTNIAGVGSASVLIAQDDKIKKDRRMALIYNNLISTGITIFSGYIIDRLIKKSSKNFVEKFKKLNDGTPNINKCIEGINILRPALIFAGIHFLILPFISTYLSDRIDKFIKNRNSKA